MNRLEGRTQSRCTARYKGLWVQVVPRLQLGCGEGVGEGEVVAPDQSPGGGLRMEGGRRRKEAKYKNIWEKRSARLQCYSLKHLIKL